MGIWNKAKQALDKAKEDLDNAVGGEIEYQERQGTLRDSKDQPLAANKRDENDERGKN